MFNAYSLPPKIQGLFVILIKKENVALDYQCKVITKIKENTEIFKTN